MAAIVATVNHFFDPNNYTLRQLDMLARSNQTTVQYTVGSTTFTVDASECALRRLYKRPTFEIFGTTDTNTAAASSSAINLSQRGVTFPTNTYRDIEVETLAFNGANRWKFRTKQRVRGGTNPALEGVEQYLTNCEAVYSATTADGTATTEVAAECIGPAWWDGAAPVAADFSSNASVISWLGGNFPVRVLLPGSFAHTDAAATAADARAVQHGVTSLTNGTSTIFIADVATPTAANWSNATAYRVYATLFPPVHTPVLIDTSPTPDEVFIGALGLSSDVVTWQINVFVGDLITDGPLV